MRWVLIALLAATPCSAASLPNPHWPAPADRGPDLLRIVRTGRSWPVTQTLHDPAGHHDWVIEALVDVDASDELGELVLVTQAFRRLDG